ncbi:hypothetical protein MFLAVUS_003222 [Mucor flavus]|uniref:Uncharacterized protein n=1 Tax=Mucor flavus TaxID=439312 RepID=A0ABP9YSG5_9FUNG
MHYYQNGVYHFVRQEQVEVSQDVYDQKTSLTDAYLEDTCQILKALEEEHVEKSTTSNSLSSLSDLICPRLFILSYKKHGRGFGGVKLKNSTESV